MIDLSDFKKSLNINDTKKALEYIDIIVENQVDELYETLLTVMIKTSNPIIRNKIAIALSDVRYEGLVEKIIMLLKRKNTEGYRGTLLYALEPLEYMGYIDFIFDLSKDNIYEVRWEAFHLIRLALDKLTLEKKNEKIEKTKEIIESLQAIVELLEQSI